METVLRDRVFLRLGQGDYPLLAVRGSAIHDGVLAYPALFVAPNPTPPALLGLLQAFTQAQQAMSSPTKLLTTTRNLRARELITGLETERAYVQTLCDASPEQAPMIAAAAAMFIGQAPAYAKPLLQAKQGVPGGPVHVIANIGLLTRGIRGKVSFNWQSSGDGGKTWISTPSTPHGDTFITGLTALTTYAFRASVTSRVGTGAWTDGVTFLVH